MADAEAWTSGLLDGHALRRNRRSLRRRERRQRHCAALNPTNRRGYCALWRSRANADTLILIEMASPEVTRWLRWYELEGDLWIGESPLPGVSLLELQRIFRTSAEAPLYDCYRVEHSHVEALQPFVATPIELTKFSFFVEADAETPREFEK